MCNYLHAFDLHKLSRLYFDTSCVDEMNFEHKKFRPILLFQLEHILFDVDIQG